MAAIMEAISYQGTPLPDTIPELVEIIIAELTDKVIAGKDIKKEMAAIAKIDQAHWDGEYDDDPDGFPKDVRVSQGFGTQIWLNLLKVFLH